MTTQRDTTQPAGGSPVERGVGRPVPQRHKLALEHTRHRIAAARAGNAPRGAIVIEGALA